MKWFLESDNVWAKFLRTLVEAGLSFLVTYIGEIVGLWNLDGNTQSLIVAAGTLFLTTILGFIHDNKIVEKDDKTTM